MPRALTRAAFVLAATALLLAPAASSASPDIVVSQVYAGGGNSGATHTNDFVELFNRGSSAVDVSGWTIQYASSTGTSWQATALSGTIQPGRHYLVQLASAGAVGSPLPTPDATGTTNMANAGGKVALVRDAALLGCGGSPGSCSAVSQVADLIGWGTATDYEAAAAAALSNTAADLRAAAGCTDSDDNAGDFASATPDPRNSSSPGSSCGSTAAAGWGLGQRVCRHRHQCGALDRARARDHQLRQRRGGRHAATGLRACDRREQPRCRVRAERPPDGVRPGRPAARALRLGAERRSAGARADRRRDGAHPHPSGARPARRHDCGEERNDGRRVAHQRRVRLAAPQRRTGEVHGDGHLHGDRAVIRARRLAACDARARACRCRHEHGAAVDRAHRDAVASGPRRLRADGGPTPQHWYPVRGRRRRPRGVVARSARPAEDRAGGRSAERARWLTVRPSRIGLAPGASASITVAARVPRRAEPGDHDALVLLTTRPRDAGGVAVRMRVGVVVVGARRAPSYDGSSFVSSSSADVAAPACSSCWS